MNQINVSRMGESFYHLLKDKKDGYTEITGWTKKELAVGDKIILYNGTPTSPEVAYEVIGVIERRNHAGEFPDPKDKINTFFRVKATLIVTENKKGDA